MASLFRVRRTEEPRSGGKTPRQRRETPSASPYARPPAPSPAAAQSESPRWLSGLISGAGKLISSVLPTYRSSESPSSSSSIYSSDEEETGSALNQDGQFGRSSLGELGFVDNRVNGQLTVVPKSEAKLAIEQLLMQESFSREECDRLTKLIQSRVVDFPSTEVRGNVIGELHSRATGNSTLHGASLLDIKKRTLTERVSYSSGTAYGFSSPPSLFEACTPDICNRAVSEAKKWLEEKKMSTPKYDSECGPCSLNTDMLQYGIETEVGSPVEMAKSYMRSLPPWRSPSFSGIGFNTPPLSGIRRFKDEASRITSDNSLTSPRGSKRGHLFVGSLDTPDEARRVRLKVIDDGLEIDKSYAMESSARVSEHQTCKSSSDQDQRELECGQPVRLPDEKKTDADHPFQTGDINSSNNLLQQEKIVDTVHSTGAVFVPSTLHQGPIQTPVGNQDVNESSQTIEQEDNPQYTSSASRIMEHAGNRESEVDAKASDNIKPAVISEGGDVTKLNGVTNSKRGTTSSAEGSALSDSSLQLNPVSVTAERTCISGSCTEDGEFHIPKEKNGSISELSADGLSAEVNANSIQETLTKGTETIMPQNGTTMKSVESVLTEPRPTVTSGRRGRKMVVRSRRGRKS